MKFKFLLTDLDGVIRHYPDLHTLKIEQKWGLSSGLIFQAAFEKELLTQAVCGFITDETWRQQAAISLAKICGDEVARNVITEWSDFLGQVDHEYLNHLASQFPGLPIAVLTNGTTRLKSDLEQLNLAQSFFKIFNSADIGICKPDIKIFQYVIQELGCKPEEILLIDDSLLHVQAAIESGMTGHHYQSLEDFRGQSELILYQSC